MEEIQNIQNSEKFVDYLVAYSMGTVFCMAIITYTYLIIVDHTDKEKHSTEEIVWIYAMYTILILGFLISFYLIFKKQA